MKILMPVLAIFSMANFAMAKNSQLDATSVVLADVLVKPEVRECIDTALLANEVTNSSDGRFSVKEVQTYTTSEPLFPNSEPLQTQQVTHYILKTRAYSEPKTGSPKMIKIVFDVKIASGTGILSYSCSSQVQ